MQLLSARSVNVNDTQWHLIYEKDFERMGEGAGLRAIFGPLRPFHYLKKSYN